MCGSGPAAGSPMPAAPPTPRADSSGGPALFLLIHSAWRVHNCLAVECCVLCAMVSEV